MNSLTALAVLLPLVLALLAAPAALLAGTVRPCYAAPVGAVFAALAALATLWVWGVGGAADVPWSPTYDLRFAVELDGLAVLYALPATEIDFAVLGYSSRYLPLHWSTGEGPNLTARASIFHTTFYGVHGGARGGTRPHPGFRVPRPHGHRFVLFDRLRLPQGGFQGLCAHGTARHQGDGGISATRGSNPLRRLRNLLHPRRCPTVGTYSMVRFPDIYTRLHTTSKAVVLGVISLLAASVVTGDSEIVYRVLVIGVFLVLTTPVSAYVITRAAHCRGERMESPGAVDESGNDLAEG